MKTSVLPMVVDLSATWQRRIRYSSLSCPGIVPDYGFAPMVVAAGTSRDLMRDASGRKKRQ